MAGVNGLPSAPPCFVLGIDGFALWLCASGAVLRVDRGQTAPKDPLRWCGIKSTVPRV